LQILQAVCYVEADLVENNRYF